MFESCRVLQSSACRGAWPSLPALEAGDRWFKSTCADHYTLCEQERVMSDIKIFGEHEPKTLAQMQRCMTVGSAVKGVLCADGHLGYAHPIGGVVAYEEHISISGVGFDIACGNMAVPLDAHYSHIAPPAHTNLAP